MTGRVAAEVGRAFVEYSVLDGRVTIKIDSGAGVQVIETMTGEARELQLALRTTLGPELGTPPAGRVDL